MLTGSYRIQCLGFVALGVEGEADSRKNTNLQELFLTKTIKGVLSVFKD